MTQAAPLRFVTAASLFDGHDAAITIIRRILQSRGAEVIHLGHDRGVDEVVRAAIQEGADGVAISSYQGGHIEYFEYLVQRLRDSGADRTRVFGGGGGVIIAEEVDRLAGFGVRIFTPEDGQQLGLVGMIDEMLATCAALPPAQSPTLDALAAGDDAALSAAIAALESGDAGSTFAAELRSATQGRSIPVLGVTGTGGSGKSSLTDEIVRRFLLDCDEKVRIGIVAVDPTRSRGGGALLGDRIRMNSVASDRVFLRSMATRESGQSVPACLSDIRAAFTLAGYDLLIVETPGIGQGDSSIAEVSDVALYVMTPEFGAATQLEKIDMLDFADAIAINKFERRGAEDALRDVARQVLRNRADFSKAWQDMPVFGTSAARFADDGVSALADHLWNRLLDHGLDGQRRPESTDRVSSSLGTPVPPSRVRYLSEVADCIRDYHRRTGELADIAGRVEALRTSAEILAERPDVSPDALEAVAQALHSEELPRDIAEQLGAWTERAAALRADETAWRTTLSGTRAPRLGLPRATGDRELVRFLREENLPGHFPFTAGVFPAKRDEEPPTRMFSGEGDPARTNARFHLLADGQPATRLSVAFDSVTLYGRDPEIRPDVYGKVGTSGVSIATLDDMRDLFAGFDLCDPSTSVSMTINGPAPAILAMFMCTAIDQQIAKAEAELGRPLTEEERQERKSWTLRQVRGTVQADILKEDQSQNTCIFSTEFALRCMGDIQQWFIENGVQRFYSVSISGYHIAEAGANPITQLAFTLANAFTYVEAYRARGMDVDDFVPSFSFFFSNGMDLEYTVIGRVARRIWAIAMRDLYGSGERAQRLKYHIQTSGRSLHAQEMSFNDIRTTLQALCAYYDNCNSLHTNAYDEAVTTPTDESVRRALAIQLIINREWGLAQADNPLQGSYLVDELTDLVEAAVLDEFDRLTQRGGVLGAMETGYQRGRIQDESMAYEHRKHDGSLPVIGVNTFLAENESSETAPRPLSRGTEAERASQLARVRDFQLRHGEESVSALADLRQTAAGHGNVFAALMDAVRVCSLGQITEAFFDVGGRYRRSM